MRNGGCRGHDGCWGWCSRDVGDGDTIEGRDTLAGGLPVDRGWDGGGAEIGGFRGERAGDGEGEEKEEGEEEEGEHGGGRVVNHVD